ncbi:MAG: hypothetical protein QOI41_6260 [Myxococcales bacterium]|nr:hypothetical protein [Myxococcales bacterium]
MKTTKFLALGLLSLLAVYGCSQSTEDDSSPDQADSEDALIGFKGSVDNVGVVEATTIMLTTTTIAPPLDSALDSYNQSDPFRIAAGTYKNAFAKNLVKFDGIDGKKDWSADQAAKWVARVSGANFQVIDTSKPCNFDDPHTYLEIERAALTGTDHKTCGGRMPNEDALDVTMNFLVRGPAASASGEGALSDGVDQATQKSDSAFPYLADLNGF